MNTIIIKIKQILKVILKLFGFEIVRIRAQKGERAYSRSFGDYERLRKTYRSYDVIKLHIGCGPRVLRGWINIDLSYEPYLPYLQYYTDRHYPPEIRGDRADFFALDLAKNELPLPDNSVEIIFHEDFIEHLNQKDQILFLAEALRVLKRGAIHRINTPDLLSSMRLHSNFEEGRKGVYADEWIKHGHINVMTPAILKEMAHIVGYSDIMFSRRDVSVSPHIPSEYRPDPNDRPETGNIFADLIK